MRERDGERAGPLSQAERKQAREWAREEVARPFDTRYPLISAALLAAEQESEALRQAILRINRTRVYEVRGQPVSGISVAMIGAIREAVALAQPPSAGDGE